MSAASGTRAIIAALTANLGIAATKFFHRPLACHEKGRGLQTLERVPPEQDGIDVQVGGLVEGEKVVRLVAEIAGAFLGLGLQQGAGEVHRNPAHAAGEEFRQAGREISGSLHAGRSRSRPWRLHAGRSRSRSWRLPGR